MFISHKTETFLTWVKKICGELKGLILLIQWIEILLNFGMKHNRQLQRASDKTADREEVLNEFVEDSAVPKSLSIPLL